MVTIHARDALLAWGWAKDVRITIADGRIGSVEAGVAPAASDERHGVLVPAACNLHSHAFQRAMSGLAEMRGPDADSFWSWRAVMYDFALSMTPDDVEAVAARLYVEMLEAGFCRVGEFHYLHHDTDGAEYADIAEMAGRIAAASATAGIGLTLLPVFYAHSGFGPTPPSAGQRRFVTSLDRFARLMEGCAGLVAGMEGANLGVAPHSLRAATLAEIAALVPLAARGPVHIHAAEQVREVEDCLAATGARPVQLLLDNAPVDADWCIIHATHLDEAEIAAMAARGAVAGLCPITEANLGDGIFAAPPFLAAGGRFGVGSDSNVLVSLAQELRQLEYSQRLASHARNVIAQANESTGLSLLRQAVEGGAAALGQEAAGIAPGNRADLVSLDANAVDYLPAEKIADAWIFGGDVRIGDVWAMGRKRVAAGRHVDREAVDARFLRTMRRLVPAS